MRIELLFLSIMFQPGNFPVTVSAHIISGSAEEPPRSPQPVLTLFSDDRANNNKLRSKSQVKLCYRAATSPLRHHNMNRFFAIQQPIVSEVVNPFLNESYPISEAMLAKCSQTQRPSDLKAFHHVLIRAKHSKSLHVCAIGGSETCGLECTGPREHVLRALNGRKDPMPPGQCAWLSRLGDWLRVIYPHWNVTVSNWARSGFNSQSSLALAKILLGLCDIVIVEQAMNDEALLAGTGDASVIKEATQNLVDEIQRQANHPAIIYLLAMRFFPHPTSCSKTSSTVLRKEALELQEIYLQTLSRHHIPLVSYRDVVAEDLHHIFCSGPHGRIGSIEDQKKTLVLHSGGHLGAHVDWRTHQLFADVLAWWWRTAVLSMCITERAGTLNQGANLHGFLNHGKKRTVQNYYIDRNAQPLHSICYGKESVDKNDTLQQGFSDLKPIQNDGWFLFSESPSKPAGWHPHPQAGGNRPVSKLRHDQMPGITFIVHCRVRVVVEDHDRFRVLSESAAGVKIGFLRTWDKSWGRASVWTSFHQEGHNPMETPCLNSSEKVVCNNVQVGAYEMSAAGLEPLLRGHHFLNASWGDRSSMNVESEIPCYQFVDRAHLGAALNSSKIKTSKRATGLAWNGKGAEKRATVAMKVHIQMETKGTGLPSSGFLHAAPMGKSKGNSANGRSSSILPFGHFQKQRSDARIIGGNESIPHFKLVSLESC